MAINATVDGVTYSGIDTINTGGKVIGLTASFPGAVDIDTIAEGRLSEAIGSASYIDSYAFYGRDSLQFASFSQALEIRRQAFALCNYLDTIYFPVVETISDNAFGNCRNLKAVDLPEVKTIDSAFFSCSALSQVSIPKTEYIKGGGFVGCTSLGHIYAPMLSSADGATFGGCFYLISADLPVLSVAGSFMFSGCNRLVSVSTPNVEIIQGGMFYNCYSLSTLTFNKASQINTINTFRNCFNLLSLYLLSTSVATLSNSNVFSSSPIAGYTASTGGVYGSIYVPASLLTAYQSATNWAFFSERFVGV